MIAVISATKQEILYFLYDINVDKIDQYGECKVIEGSFLKHNILIAISGVGIKRAKDATNLIATKYKPSIILSVGTCGALDPKLKVGEVIVGEQVLSLLKYEKYRLFNDLHSISGNYRKGTILSENRFVNKAADKLEIFNKTGASCVDMETWGIANIADRYGINVLAIRVVSDGLKLNLPDMAKLFDFNSGSGYNLYKTVRYFIKRPHELFIFLKFKFIYHRKAKIKINSFLRYIIPIIDEKKTDK